MEQMEPSQNVEITIDTEGTTVDEDVSIIISYLMECGYEL